MPRSRRSGSPPWRRAISPHSSRRSTRRPRMVGSTAKAGVVSLLALGSCVAPVDLGGGVGGLGQPGRAPRTALPPLPDPFTNVVVTGRGDSVGVDIDPVDDAVDYRIYPLPPDGDVMTSADGTVTVKNAVYRCAGARNTYDLQNN